MWLHIRISVRVRVLGVEVGLHLASDYGCVPSALRVSAEHNEGIVDLGLEIMPWLNPEATLATLPSPVFTVCMSRERSNKRGTT